MLIVQANVLRLAAAGTRFTILVLVALKLVCVLAELYASVAAALV